MDTMSKRRPTWPAKLLLMVAVSIFCAAPVLADGDRVTELENRVAELESVIQQLLADRQGDAQSRSEVQRLAEESRATREQVDRISERVEPVISKAEEAASGLEFYWGGYVKTDVIASNYDDGDLAAGSIGRDFFIPGTIPVGGDGEGTDVDIHARETRFHFGTRYQINENAQLGSYVEFDFLATPNGDERVSNSYTPRMRHAYLTYNDWLAGQTWSTFMDVSTLPEALDFIGPSGSTSFVRQTQLRYTSGNFAIALENPETTVTPNGGGGRIVTDDNLVPDLAARYTWRGDWGHLQLGGLLRQLEFEDASLAVDDSTMGWGISLSGKVNLGRDDFRWMLVHGEGLGRYVGINFSNGAVIDNNGDLEAIGSTGGFAAYRHWWNDQWRSSVVLSYMEVDNPISLTGNNANESNWSGHVNLLYSPVTPLTFGIEYILAERDLESGASGRMDRLQFSGKYAF